jgi:hypothetical protein
MDTLTILDNSLHMYGVDTYDEEDMTNLNNKLFCSFTTEDNIDELVDELSSRYNILYGKIFVLNILSNSEFVCTYNVDSNNLNNIPANTIFLHRKKHTNTLYTINALNVLIKTLNGGVMDSNFAVNWADYRNTILLTQQGELKQLKTKIHKIVEV